MESDLAQKLADLSNLLRIDVIDMCEAAGSGHPTTCSSAAELMTCLHFHPDGMRFNPEEPKNFSNDRFVMSKGHAAPMLYAVWAHTGHFSKDKLKTLRKIDSPFEGHPTPKLDFIDVATGSLGQGLGAACGMAYASKHVDKIENRYYCLMGDGETVEGSVWEAAHFAYYYKLDNLTAIIDVNGLGQSGFTSIKDQGTEPYVKRFEAFGWETMVINGHDTAEVIKALQEARKDHNGRPFAIIAKTEKGRNFGQTIEGKLNWHGKVLGKEAANAINYLKSLIKDPNVQMKATLPKIDAKDPGDPVFSLPDKLDYDHTKEIAIRTGYGKALKRIADSDKQKALLAVDGDTKVSTYACVLEDAYPERFIEGWIAEQNMVSVAQGLAVRKKVPFVSTFAAFLTRAYDQMRMGTISLSNVKYVGSHAGVSLGEDGASQMGLEDFAMFRALHGCIVFYPSDAISCERAVLLAANYRGACYIRTSRPNSKLLYANDEKFEIGKAKVLTHDDSDKLTVASAGITLIEAKKAVDELKAEGINIRLVDLFTIKPIDAATLVHSVAATNNRLLVIEEHYPYGGIYEAVAGALGPYGVKIYNVSVDRLPRSGKPDELLRMYNLTAPQIKDKIKSLL
jgi:transketolase